jgi:beta-glucosidase
LDKTIRKLKEEAVRAAEKADAVIMVLGLSQRLEGEEMPIKLKGFSVADRTDMNLPEMQEELLKLLQPQESLLLLF